MICETILFSGEDWEFDLLQLKLRTHWPTVDAFYLTEATKTFAGEPKELKFPSRSAEFKWANEKLHYVPIEDLQTDPENRWIAENDQRERGIKAIGQHNKDYVVLDMCVDEVLVPSKIEEAVTHMRNTGRPVTFHMNLHMYYLDYIWEGRWFWGMGCLMSHYDIRSPQDWAWARMGAADGIMNAGWHFSTLGGTQAVKRKLETFSHKEYDNSDIKDNLENILESRKIFWAPEDRTLNFVPYDPKYYPNYLNANLQVYGKYFKQVPNA